MISIDIMPVNAKRTALLIRCSVEEAEAIRSAARNSGRTLSGYVLHCLRNRLRIEAQIKANFAELSQHRKLRP
jgi:hypothetical protein